jgi:hypothetical protein
MAVVNWTEHARDDLHITAVRENICVFPLGGESIATSYGANRRRERR